MRAWHRCLGGERRERFLLGGREEGGEIVNEDEAVRQPCDPSNVLRSGRKGSPIIDFGCAEASEIQDAVDAHQDASLAGLGQDQMIAWFDALRRQPEALAEVEDRQDVAPDIHDAFDDLRCLGQRNDSDRLQHRERHVGPDAEPSSVELEDQDLPVRSVLNRQIAGPASSFAGNYGAMGKSMVP